MQSKEVISIKPNHHREYHDLIRYFILISVLGILYISILIIQPFVTALLTGAIISYVFYPLYNRLRKPLRSDSVSALLVSALIIILVAVPLIFVLDNVAPEARYVYVRAKQHIITGELIDIDCSGKQTALCRVSEFIKDVVRDPSIKNPLQDMLGKLTSLAIEKTSSVLLSLPGIVLSIIVTFFITFYLFLDGPVLVAKVKNLIPLEHKHKEHIFQKFQDTTYAVIYGSLIIAMIQGTLGGIGFFMFGITSPILWGLVMMVTALIPFVGTPVVWLPAALIQIGKGSTLNDPTMIWQGIGLLVYGLCVVSTIDNILKPKLIGDRAGVHPILIMLGVLGGLALVGFIGFIIGPLVLAMLNALIEIYEKEKKGL